MMSAEQRILTGLIGIFGENVYVRPDDPSRVGIEFEDGTFINVQLTRVYAPPAGADFFANEPHDHMNPDGTEQRPEDLVPFAEQVPNEPFGGAAGCRSRS